MARMIPPYLAPHTKSSGERLLFHRFRDEPGTTGWVVLHSLNLARHQFRIEGEADFVVIVPGLGVLCIEVKATSRIRRSDGVWYYGEDKKGDVRGPFRQASEACHSLRKEVTRALPSVSQVPFWSAVCFPFIEFKERSTEWHDWQVVDRAGLAGRGLAAAVVSVLKSARHLLASRASAGWFDVGSPSPTAEECERIAAVLRPSFEVLQSRKVLRAEKQAEISAFTTEQYLALDALEENPRILLHGPAGTGKTVLALEAARRLAAEGRRVLLLCFNRLLAHQLAEEGAALHITKVASLHRYMRDLAKETPGEHTNLTSTYWETELPEKALEGIVEDVDGDAQWDAIVVDEAQDICRSAYLDFLDLSLVGGLKAGTFRFFGDFERQMIYGQDGRRDLSSRSSPSLYHLTVNCRNTPRVASLAHLLGGLDPEYSKILRPDDGRRPALRFYSNTAGRALLLKESINELFDEGFPADEIVVLSTRADHPAATLLQHDGLADRLTIGGDRVRGRIICTTIHAFKGLESPAVVLTDFDTIDDDRARDLFYIGVTRALHRLHIISAAEVRSQMLEVLT